VALDYRKPSSRTRRPTCRAEVLRRRVADAGGKSTKGANGISGGAISARAKLQPQRAQRTQIENEYFMFSAFFRLRLTTARQAAVKSVLDLIG
jgi:hypothetical protein